MSEYTDQLLTERRVNLARIAELESILRRVSIALQSNAITDGFTIDALNSDINDALKGTK